MFCHRRMSAQDRRKRIHKRHVLIIAACILLTVAVIGGTYCITTILLQRTKSAHTAHIASSPTNPKSTSNLFTASTGDPTEEGAAFEVRKINLTGYKARFPNLYAREKVGQWKNVGNKTVYLTFDDGPSALTPKLLDVLKKYHVKATFFLTNQPGQKNDIHYIRDIYEAGSACAVHSACHNYKKIYTSVDAFLDDFNEMYQIIQQQTDGHCAPFYRFPGGSNNPRMSASVHKAIIQEMMRRGFFFYDWDVDSKDAMGAASGRAIYDNVIRGMQHGGGVVLMHNAGTKKATLSEVGNIIQYGIKNGYTFKAMDGTLDPSMYSFSNQTFIPLLKNNPNFKLSDKHEARFASLLGLSPASSFTSRVSSASSDRKNN